MRKSLPSGSMVQRLFAKTLNTLDCLKNQHLVMKCWRHARHAQCAAASVSNALDDLLHRYSSFYRLKRAVCWFVKFIGYLRKKDVQRAIYVPEMESAETRLLKCIQGVVFPVEMAAFEKTSRFQRQVRVVISSRIIKMASCVLADACETAQQTRRSARSSCRSIT